MLPSVPVASAVFGLVAWSTLANLIAGISPAFCESLRPSDFLELAWTAWR